MTEIYRHDLISYVYCSKSTSEITTANISQIVASAQKRNPQMDITGLLACGGGMFLQWLEGPHHAVHELMTLIKKDPRHECVLQLHSFSGLDTRMYPGWSMELIDASDIQTVLIQAAKNAGNAKHAQAITMLLQLFETGPLTPITAPL